MGELSKEDKKKGSQIIIADYTQKELCILKIKELLSISRAGFLSLVLPEITLEKQRIFEKELVHKLWDIESEKEEDYFS